MPHSRWVLVEGRGLVEPVAHQRVGYLNAATIVIGNCDVLAVDNSVRRQDVLGPIPVRNPKLGRSLLPTLRIHSKPANDANSLLLDQLLSRDQSFGLSSCIWSRTSTRRTYGLCQVGNKAEPWVQYPPNCHFPGAKEPWAPFQTE